MQITISRRAALIIAVTVLLVIPGVASATHMFTDVADGSTHAAGIEWVANAGVTAGCGDGSTYCPNDAVNRAQMATFMHRLSGNAPGIAPSVHAATADDASTLDGIDAVDLLPGGTPPAGTTVTGSYFVDFSSNGSGWRASTSASFGFALEGPPTAVLLRAGDPPTTECPGSPSSPEAAPGYLCVYEFASVNVSAVCTLRSTPTYSCNRADPYGFGVFVTATAAGGTYSNGSWALTVPEPGVLTPLGANPESADAAGAPLGS